MGWAEAARFCRTVVVPAIAGGFHFNAENGRLVQLLQFYGMCTLVTSCIPL